MAFDEHKSMKDIMEIYYDSMIIMGKYWTKQEMKMIHEILIEYVEANDIVDIIFQMIFGAYYNILLESS